MTSQACSVTTVAAVLPDVRPSAPPTATTAIATDAVSSQTAAPRRAPRTPVTVTSPTPTRTAPTAG